jgi:hypothetical protein
MTMVSGAALCTMRRMGRAANPAKAAEFTRTAERLQRERAAAVPVVRMIRRMVAARISFSVPPEWVTAGVAEKLSDAVREVLPDAPGQGRALAECAVAVAGRLDGSYPGIIRAATLAHAWAAVAAADCRDGHPETALPSLDRADEALRGQRGLGHDQAIVDMVRAAALHALGRGKEAAAVLEGARRSFEEHGDTRRIGECARLRAAIVSGLRTRGRTPPGR